MVNYTEKAVNMSSKLVQPVLSFAEVKAGNRRKNTGLMDRVSIRSVFSPFIRRTAGHDSWLNGTVESCTIICPPG